MKGFESQISVMGEHWTPVEGYKENCDRIRALSTKDDLQMRGGGKGDNGEGGRPGILPRKMSVILAMWLERSSRTW